MTERLHGVDANLLQYLHAVLEERNLTRAGHRLQLSQPAMSAALSRLRKHFDDALLARSGSAFELTPLGRELLPDVEKAVAAASVLMNSTRTFDPLTSSKRFSVSLSEYAMTVLATPLGCAFDAQAPGCTLALDPLDVRHDEVEGQLLRRDLVVAPMGFDLPGRTQPVFTDELVCVVARNNARLKDGALTLDDLTEMSHAVAEFAPAGGRRRPLELAFEERGLVGRNVLVQVTSLLTLPFAVAGTSMCAFVPSRLARKCATFLDLVIAQTPIEVRITEAAHWHHRRDQDPAVLWLRHLLHEVAVDLEDELG